MKESMKSKGYKQGDMSPHVEDYQAKESEFPECGFSKTTEYIERQDAFRGRESKEIKSQSYKGRYS
jgi:hypothetical protein